MSPHLISGIHHITAIASDPQANLDFYCQTLGLRLVKRTVNFDDPGTYHLYFGNADGSPGSIVTFFPWPGASRGTVGNGQVSTIAFAVPSDSLDFWRDRLRNEDVPAEDLEPRFDQGVIRLADPDGTPLELVASPDADPIRGWKTPSIPDAYSICGLHSATLAEEGYEKTAELLQQTLGWQPIGNEGNRYRYALGAASGQVIDVVCAPGARPGRLGAGTVHHIAWRTPDDEQQQAWRDTLVRSGFNVSPIMNREYFRSIYFREPGGVLFEIATDPPGFAVDEAREHLGQELKLPSWLEGHRKEIEQALPALKVTPS